MINVFSGFRIPNIWQNPRSSCYLIKYIKLNVSLHTRLSCNPNWPCTKTSKIHYSHTFWHYNHTLQRLWKQTVSMIGPVLLLLLHSQGRIKPRQCSSIDTPTAGSYISAAKTYEIFFSSFTLAFNCSFSSSTVFSYFRDFTPTFIFCCFCCIPVPVIQTQAHSVGDCWYGLALLYSSVLSLRYYHHAPQRFRKQAMSIIGPVLLLLLLCPGRIKP